MIRRDYRSEIGLPPATPKVSWPIAVIVLAAAAGALWFGVQKLQSLPDRRQAAQDPVPAKVAPAKPAATHAAAASLVRK